MEAAPPASGEAAKTKIEMLLSSGSNSVLRRCMGGSFADCLARQSVSALVLAVALAAFGTSVYTAQQLAQIGMPDNYFFPDDSSLADWNEGNDRLFGGGMATCSLIPATGVDYSDPASMLALQGLLTRLSNRGDVIVVDGWWGSWTMWQAQVLQQAAAAGAVANASHTSLGAFLQTVPAYQADVDGRIRPDSDGSDVSWSRAVAYVRLPPSSDVAARHAQYESLEHELDGLPFGVTIASPTFALHLGRYEEIKPMMFTTLGLSIAAAFIALTIFISPFAAAVCTVNILFVVTDVLGCVYYLGASFNAITFTTCVMAVGFCVDYSVPPTAPPRLPCAALPTSATSLALTCCTQRCRSMSSTSLEQTWAGRPRRPRRRCSFAGRRFCTGRPRPCSGLACSWRGALTPSVCSRG